MKSILDIDEHDFLHNYVNPKLTSITASILPTVTFEENVAKIDKLLLNDINNIFQKDSNDTKRFLLNKKTEEIKQYRDQLINKLEEEKKSITVYAAEWTSIIGDEGQVRQFLRIMFMNMIWTNRLKIINESGSKKGYGLGSIILIAILIIFILTIVLYAINILINIVLYYILKGRLKESAYMPSFWYVFAGPLGTYYLL